jgi:HlyD family secretion protein
MNRSRKRLAWGGAVVTVAALLVALLRPAPIAVETARAARGPLRETVDAEGQTRVRDRYVVAAPVAGRVGRLALQEGDSVAPGQVLVAMYPAPLDARAREQAQARLAQAEDAHRAGAAAVAQARSTADQARRGRARAQELAAKGLIAPEERERSELGAATSERELESADFRAQAAAHDVEVARAALLGERAGPLVLRSPVRGRVLRIPERSERVVAVGSPLFELGDCSRLEIVADLLSSDAVRVRPGDPLLVEGWGGPALHGRLRLIEPSGFTKVSALGIEEQRVNVIGDFGEPAPGLGDRFRIELRIVTWEGNAVLRIPGSALFRQGDGWGVFALEKGRAALRLVTVGHRTPFEAEILGGLHDGDRVIRNPTDRIEDGVRVRAP